jgi:osmotically-inducible protein OsmY
MVKNQKLTAALAVALVFGVVTVSMWTRHNSLSTNKSRVHANAMEPIDDQAIEKALRGNNVAVSDLSVRSVGGIVILRGNGDAASADQAVSIVKSMGPTRVANLITKTVNNDDAIARDAERQLAATNSLEGCTLKVRCENGILSVTGTVQHELQKDAARNALRAVHGAKEVKVSLSL